MVNGILDGKLCFYPDIKSVIKTHKSVKFMRKVEAKVINHFNNIYEEQIMIEELADKFMDYNIILQINFTDKKAKQISYFKGWQRTKKLSTNHQQQLRREKKYLQVATVKLDELQRD